MKTGIQCMTGVNHYKPVSLTSYCTFLLHDKTFSRANCIYQGLSLCNIPYIEHGSPSFVLTEAFLDLHLCAFFNATYTYVSSHRRHLRSLYSRDPSPPRLCVSTLLPAQELSEELKVGQSVSSPSFLFVPCSIALAFFPPHPLAFSVHILSYREKRRDTNLKYI